MPLVTSLPPYQTSIGCAPVTHSIAIYGRLDGIGVAIEVVVMYIPGWHFRVFGQKLHGQYSLEKCGSIVLSPLVTPA